MSRSDAAEELAHALQGSFMLMDVNHCSFCAKQQQTNRDALSRWERVVQGVPQDDAALFVLGDFTMHSGDIGHWKIECDALTDADIECLAYMLSERLPRFGWVRGIPRGGLRLAAAMEQYVTHGPVLVVDDVLTTGASMEEARTESSIGAVIFARGECPSWITPLFSLARAALSESTGTSGSDNG